jgi:cytochrome c oxidase cbb3-type subunit III
MADRTDVDHVSGTATTGHEWDGIKELNTPLPRWWVVVFYATIVWAFGYWVVYPAWPTITGYTAGMFGYSSRAQVATDLADLQKARGEKAVALGSVDVAAIERDPALLAFAQAQGKAAFGNNCAPCHGSGATGSKGYPNLNDDDWLWGGTINAIYTTISFGVRSGHPKAHESAMPAFGRDGILKRDEIRMVANYVRSLSGLSVRSELDLADGKAVFAANCAACHGDGGKGNQDVGAPNLTDQIWLYGSDEAGIIETIADGRGGVMPAWTGRLDPTTIKSLAVYVHTLGGGQ